jgi:hypothetical protein
LRSGDLILDQYEAVSFDALLSNSLAKLVNSEVVENIMLHPGRYFSWTEPALASV